MAFPIMLDPAKVRIGVAGQGAGLERRLELLRSSGVAPAAVFQRSLPSAQDIAGLHVLFVAGLSPSQSRALAEAARREFVFVNVEDSPELCDFHVPAQVRRGDLVMAVSTSGRAPALAKLLKEELERRFDPGWGERLDEAAQLRSRLRAQGLEPAKISEATRAFLKEQDWL